MNPTDLALAFGVLIAFGLTMMLLNINASTRTLKVTSYLLMLASLGGAAFVGTLTLFEVLG